MFLLLNQMFCYQLITRSIKKKLYKKTSKIICFGFVVCMCVSLNRSNELCLNWACYVSATTGHTALLQQLGMQHVCNNWACCSMQPVCNNWACYLPATSGCATCLQQVGVQHVPGLQCPWMQYSLWILLCVLLRPY